MLTKKKIITNSLVNKVSKPDTVTRAGITANTKYTRGKQLVEHDPFELIPDPQNPRPGELIDESWLREHLYLGSDTSLCMYDEKNGQYVIPDFDHLNVSKNDELEESYNFLKELAYSIRNEGLIEPIEIFLADKNNDPDYFNNSSLEYGYVILEGHQRRLAAMMAGVKTVTCIEITDESMLAKLKVKHRKLRRQLSENNLRKGLTVAQNFKIVQELFSDKTSESLTNKELSSIIGLNESIASALRSICSEPRKYPQILFDKIAKNQLTFKAIRLLVSKSYSEIEKILNDNSKVEETVQKKTKARGKNGGAIKKSATFKINKENEAVLLQKLLIQRFPELESNQSGEQTFKSLEGILNFIKDLAIKELA
ncbi:chromosome partitioning protein ParB (plasmid) [Legionella geestiana]|uniref:ParB/RepB/Spo0J family partition protein n=1 Tax=Legionella geestiana TaxID=45065 RepID=UPI001092A983|nr:ParB N-terminal domain-containing protein [Legionella geestiana]QDQ41192.1 chromosome partitioning protein ParB [Legionella geestiana]